jgi:hypothetical protein
MLSNLMDVTGDRKTLIIANSTCGLHNFQRLNVLAVGLNWLLKGRTCKLTLDYQHRPVFTSEDADLIKTSNNGQIVLQYQVSF